MEQLPVETPAFIYDEARLTEDGERIARIARASGCRLLYSLKASAIAGIVEIIGNHVEGFSASSIFENRMVREILGPHTLVHTTCPGLQAKDFASICGPNQYVSCNSISQLESFAREIDPSVNLGLRVNPGLSLVSDARYDPCRKHSKLGASPAEISGLFTGSSELARRVGGVLVHNNCDAEDFLGLVETLRILTASLPNVLSSLNWVNLGGGYLFPSDASSERFSEAIHDLRSRTGLEVFIEPGAALVRHAVTYVASVVDRFERDGRCIAVLDGTVNHMPEVFEYQDVEDNEPWVSGHTDDGTFTYLLVGGTCLAGDIFGEYSFEQPLAIGSQISFPDTGAYAFSKAHWFNGVNLPNIYAKSAVGGFTQRQQFTFSDFARHNGAAL